MRDLNKYAFPYDVLISTEEELKVELIVFYESLGYEDRVDPSDVSLMQLNMWYIDMWSVVEVAIAQKGKKKLVRRGNIFLFIFIVVLIFDLTITFTLSCRKRGTGS